MAIKTAYSRTSQHRLSTALDIPTVPLTDPIDDTWVYTDIMRGEISINVTDDKMWFRSDNGIIEVQTGASTLSDLQDVLDNGAIADITGNPFSVTADTVDLIGVTDITLTSPLIKVEGALEIDPSQPIYALSGGQLDLDSGGDVYLTTDNGAGSDAGVYLSPAYGVEIFANGYTSSLGIYDTSSYLSSGDSVVNLYDTPYAEPFTSANYQFRAGVRNNTGGTSQYFNGLYLGTTTGVATVKSPTLGTGLNGAILNSINSTIEEQSLNGVIIGGENNVISTLTEDSGILAGLNNTVSGIGSGIIGGNFNTVSGIGSGIISGVTNDVSGDRSGILAGDNNTVSGYRSGILAGLNNTVSGDSSVILGGVNITAANNNTAYVPDLVITKSHAIPVNSADAVGDVGSVTWDSSYLYVKTAVGAWKRTALSTF